MLFYAEVETPALDATVLLAEALSVSKERLLACLPDAVDAGSYERYRRFLRLRCTGLPVSYIRRRKEFYGLEFAVDERVLVPRPDTETLIEEALQCLEEAPDIRRVHDGCTGTGCIAITLAHLRPELEVSASDISPQAQEVFRQNCLRILERQLPFFLSDLLAAVPGRFDLITANPPYLSAEEVRKMKKIGWPEPEVALDGGEDGTALSARLIRQAPAKLSPGGVLLLEAAPQQMEALGALLEEAGFRGVSVRQDLAGRQRVLRAGV